MTDSVWYNKGIYFQCMGCGRCCCDHGEYTVVYLVGDDAVHMSRILEISELEFLASRCIVEDGAVQLRIDGDTCPFLVSGKCSIYKARPMQCRAWPFWRSNLRVEIWEKEVLPICPGIGRGRLYNQEEIDLLADAFEEAFDEPLFPDEPV